MARSSSKIEKIEKEDDGGSIGQQLAIPAPRFRTITVPIRGTSPYVQNKFSQKMIDAMRAKHEAGSTATKGKKRERKDFQAMYEGAQHKDAEGRFGLPAPAFRAAMVSACRLVGFKMTMAKLSVFVEHDFIDAEDSTPLVAIEGEPRKLQSVTRLATGVPDVIWRPCWDQWTAKLRVKFDEDQFTPVDVVNLVNRVGQQVGIGCGRHDSKTSTGQGWGTFEVIEGQSPAA